MYSFIVYSFWLNIFCTWISPGEFHHFVRFERIFKRLNWFYYILSKASDLRCQQVIFSKSQVMDSKSKSSPKSMREVASQVTCHKNGDSSRTRVQVTWLESTSLDIYPPPPQLEALPPLNLQSEGKKIQKSAIFGNFFYFCPLIIAFFPSMPPP